MNSQIKNKFIIFVCIISIFILLCGVLIGFFFRSHINEKLPPSIPFNSDEWKTMDITERYKMYEDLEKNYNLVGKSYTEIIDLLGDSGGIYDPDGNQDNKNYYLHYTIRYDKWEGYEVILIHFKDDIVTEVEKEYLEYL